MHWSARSNFDRTPNPLERARAAALRDGRTFIDLTRGNPTDVGLPRFERAVEALLHAESHLYRPEPFGLLSARKCISAWLATQGTQVPEDRIVLTASTSEAYAYLFKLLCDPGDEVLVPAPSYPLLTHLAQLEHVRLSHYDLHYDGHWHAPRFALEAALSERTRAIVCVHPNNPTGSYLKKAELLELAALGLPIISDEVFSAYSFEPDPTRVQTALEARQTLVFALHGLSKLAGLPQLKLAFLCVSGPEALVDEALRRMELIADSFLSPSTPVQLALPEILAHHAPYTGAIRKRTAANLRNLKALAEGTSTQVLRVEGGWYAVLRMPALFDDEAWALQLLERAGVLVQPGHFFDFAASPPHLVLGLLCQEAEFTAGVARILDCVAQAVATVR